MSRHLERLLAIDALLRSPERQTAPAMAAVLEVNERTIRNDIAFLRDRYSAPVEYSKTKGFHYTDSDWRLPSISLSKGELFALTLGARMLEAYSGSAYAPELRSAIERLAERLPDQTRIDLQQVADERISFRSGAEISLDPDIWHGLENAAQASQQVWIRYYTASRDAYSERAVDPYLLYIYRGTNPYLIGFCHKRQEVRWFRVDRIQELRQLNQTFVRNPSFNKKDHMEMIFQHEAGGVPMTVQIWFDAPTAPYIRERRWHTSQKLAEYEDGSVTLQMTVRGLNDVKRWILGYGKGARVLGPPTLLNMLRNEIQDMQQQYSNEIPGRESK